LRTNFSKFDLTQALKKVGLENLIEWHIEVEPKVPSAYFRENQQRLRRFDTGLSEGAKLLLVDALFGEAIQPYTRLKVFKETTIQSTDMGGLVDYLISRDGKVLILPFVCVSEAKKDDFEKGLAQCLVEMQVCAERNALENHNIILFGIVTNGSTWQFYKRDISGIVYESSTYGIFNIEIILAILDHIFAECEQNTKTITI
jgi:hypothetical protein